MDNPNGSDFQAWFQRNRKVILIAGGIGLIVAALGSAQETSSGTEPQYDGGEGGGIGGGGNPQAGGDGAGGGVDMDEWRRRQAQDDEEQRRRVRTIREEERCADGNVVSIHDGC